MFWFRPVFVSSVMYLLNTGFIDHHEARKLPIIVTMFSQNKSILCMNKRNQSDSILWKHNQVIVSYGIKSVHPSYYASRNKYGNIQLTIKKITNVTLGIYTCEEKGKKKSIVTYDLKVADKPNINNHSATTLTISEGEKVELWCLAESALPSNTTWYLHGNIDLPIGIATSKLYIENITRHCSAVYRCVVSNKKGNNSKDFNVIVKHEPMIRIEVNNKTVDSEDNTARISRKDKIILECVINAEPRPAYIEWSINDKHIGSWNETAVDNLEVDQYFKQRYMLMKEGEPFDLTNRDALLLQIPDPKEEDFENFRCLASNIMGSHSTSVNLVHL